MAKRIGCFLEDDGRKEALNQVVTTRNSIAHGGDGSITYSTIKRYYAKILEIIEFIEQQTNT
jgi:hypothetical protein